MLLLLPFLLIGVVHNQKAATWTTQMLAQGVSVSTPTKLTKSAKNPDYSELSSCTSWEVDNAEFDSFVDIGVLKEPVTIQFGSLTSSLVGDFMNGPKSAIL